MYFALVPYEQFVLQKYLTMCTQSNFDMIGIQVLLDFHLDFGLTHDLKIMSYWEGYNIKCVFYRLVSLTKDWEAPTKQPYNEQVT